MFYSDYAWIMKLCVVSWYVRYRYNTKQRQYLKFFENDGIVETNIVYCVFVAQQYRNKNV
jgi:hypothetical protein